MIVALTPARRRARPSVPVMAALVVAVFGSLIAASVLAGRSSTPPAGRVSHAAAVRALLSYENAIYPATQRAGQAIVAGILPDIDDFQAGRISAPVWELDMRARHREFAAARATFDRASAPASVGDAQMWFDRAFSDYQHAVGLLLAAGPATGPQRASLISQGEAVGQTGDHAFDQGTARIQAARRALGLGPDARFSNTGAK